MSLLQYASPHNNLYYGAFHDQSQAQLHQNPLPPQAAPHTCTDSNVAKCPFE